MNAEMAKALVGGRLDRNPLMHGLLAQCLDRLEKQERGIETMRGKPANATMTKSGLLQNAAMSLAMLGGNRRMAADLGPKVTPPRIRLELLEQFSLPNPCLSLLAKKRDQLAKNFVLLDQRYPRTPEMSSRRLILAFDATYLLKTVAQLRIADSVGLVGGPWTPSYESLAWVDFDRYEKDMRKAQVMYEFLAWDPNSPKRQSFSVASMPMSLKAPKSCESETQVSAANWEP